MNNVKTFVLLAGLVALLGVVGQLLGGMQGLMIGLVFGVLPGDAGVSWQSHLGGFAGGALAARWFARSGAALSRVARLGRR